MEEIELLHAILKSWEVAIQLNGINQQLTEHLNCVRSVAPIESVTLQFLHRNSKTLKLVATVGGDSRMIAESTSIVCSEKKWLSGLRFQRLVRDFTIVHATLDTPHKWGYVTTTLDAAASFTYQHTTLCFIGHTHRPVVYVRDGSVSLQPFETFQIEKNKKYLINVGSVGQPRDSDWRSAYCIYDIERQEVELRRVEYDIRGAQAAILAAGLPEKLATRLEKGR
jgi:diadenosine tetraphosphatase ApaH/serine/threonine PP2A family protein phosphatase